MVNNVILVGRIVKIENIERKMIITIAITRAYKNANGEYDTDLIDCVLWRGVADVTSKYCKEKDLIGIKGRIQVTESENKERKMEIIAERVTILNSKKEEEK